MTRTIFALCVAWSVVNATPLFAENYPVVDTGQIRCYNDWSEIEYPQPGEPYFGQDAQFEGHQPQYRDNGDGTVSDLVTGLMWQKSPGAKKTFAEAAQDVHKCRLGGYDDWRLPNIKELYSLILFSGTDPDANSTSTKNLKPFIDTKYFDFQYGNPQAGERVIDSQWATSTIYVGKTMGGATTMFGVNFADGRIKGYPIDRGPGGRSKGFYAIYVRGNPAYGKNDFIDNGDGTVTDRATGLTWMQVDSGVLRAGQRKDGKMNWGQALRWAEELKYAGRNDWRLPNAKELQSIVDYTRSPDTTKSPAIDPVFKSTPIKNAGGAIDYAHYWTSTSHKRGFSANTAVYIAFGRALGFMSDRRFGGSSKRLMDVHGAGAQRSDPKSGDPRDYPQGRGPQGDVIGIENMVRLVRGGAAEPQQTGPKVLVQSQGPQGGGPGGGIPSFVGRLDRNGDGKVSRQEFDGPPSAFSHHDRNRDGYLSEDEAPRPPQGGGPPRGGGSRGGRGQAPSSRRSPTR